MLHEKKLWSLRSVPATFVDQILKKLYFKPRLGNEILFKVPVVIRKRIGKAVFLSQSCKAKIVPLFITNLGVNFFKYKTISLSES